MLDREILRRLQELLKVPEEELPKTIERLKNDIIQFQQELRTLKEALSEDHREVE